MAQMDFTRNYYADLGVSPTADEAEIRKAYRKLALQYHPDRNRGREIETTTKFQEIQAAIEVLGNATARATYDQKRRKTRASVPSYSSDWPRTRPQPARSAYTTTNSGPHYRPSAPRPPPPQHHTTYTNGADRFTSKNFRTPPTAQRPSARRPEGETKANYSSAWAKMKPARGEEQAKPPNPNNPNGTPFGRSKSTRTPSKTGFDPTTPGGDEGQARSSYRSSYERPVHCPPPTAESPEASSDEARGEGPDVPYAEGSRVRTPYATRAGERTSIFGESARHSASARSSPSNRRRSATDAAENYGFAQKSQGPTPQPRAFASMYPTSSDSSDEEEADVFKGRSRTARAAAPPPPPPPPAAKEPQSNRAQFRFGEASQPPHRPFQSRSDESINMRFSPSDWHGKFEGTADFFAPNTQKRTTTNDRTSPTRGRPSQRTSQQKSQFSGSQPPAAPPQFKVPLSSAPLNTQTASANGTASVPKSAGFAPQSWTQTFSKPQFAFAGSTVPSQPVKFTQDAWTSTFQSSTWAMPQTTKDTSPRRGTSAQKRPKANIRKSSTAPNTTGSEPVSEEPTAKHGKYQAFAEEATNGEEDVMDIDSDTPPVEKPAPLNRGSDYTFKSGNPIQFSPTTREVHSSPQGQTPHSTGTLPKNAEPKSASGLDGLNGLRNVEPLQPSSNGDVLSGGLTDLGDTLPFPSRASNLHPTKPKTPRDLQYGKVPAPPTPPAKLDQLSVGVYFTQMEFYVRAFREWDRTILKHFDAREADFESLDEHFISNRGETTNKLGFPSYMRKSKEDLKVRMAWNAGHEMHLQTMELCDEIRNKTMKQRPEQIKTPREWLQSPERQFWAWSASDYAPGFGSPPTKRRKGQALEYELFCEDDNGNWKKEVYIDLT